MKKTYSVIKTLALAATMCVIGSTAIVIKYNLMLVLHLAGAAMPYSGRREWIRTIRRALFRGERNVGNFDVNLSWSLRNLYSETLKAA